MSYGNDQQKDQKTPEPTEQQKAQARQWGERLDRALKKQREAKQEERFKKLRKYVRGDVGDDGQGGLVRTNIIHSNFASILPQIYAKNPEISVTPSEAASGERFAWVPQFCKTMQAVLNREFIKRAKLKPRAKAAIRAAMTTAMGWTKVSWQNDVRTDPLIENRISDTQENLQRIRHLIEEIEEGDGKREELEAQQAELQQQLDSLQRQVEVSVVRGLVIDRPLTEDIFILDDTIYDFDGYEQADAIAHRVWMTCDTYEQTFGKPPPKTATKYGSNKKESSSGGAAANEVQLVAVFEIWNRVSNHIMTICAGADEWAREPYPPNVTGQRFYSMFALAFNPTDGRCEPLSDTELLVELQDEYNTTRTNFAEHRKENLPVRVYRKGGSLTDSDVSALANRKSNEWIGIEGDPSVPLEKDIAVLQNPTIDPSTYDVGPILRDAEMVLGASDASKGFINKAKTATEAEIMAMGLQSRVGERQDVVEDWIAEMARYAAEILLQELTLEDVRRIAGADAVWPEMSKDQIFDLVEIDIRAGSTGKPNQAREREQWVQLLPQIKEAIVQVADMRAKGQDDMAATVLKLLEETLRRFDERIDIEAFLPQQPEDGAEIPPEVKQQLDQAKSMLEQLQVQNAELQQQLQDKQGEVKAAMDKAQIAANAGVEESRIKAEAQAASAIEVARVKAESEERLAAMNGQNAQMLAGVMDQMRQMMACMMEHMGKPVVAESAPGIVLDNDEIPGGDQQ